MSSHSGTNGQKSDNESKKGASEKTPTDEEEKQQKISSTSGTGSPKGEGVAGKLRKSILSAIHLDKKSDNAVTSEKTHEEEKQQKISSPSGTSSPKGEGVADKLRKGILSAISLQRIPFASKGSAEIKPSVTGDAKEKKPKVSLHSPRDSETHVIAPKGRVQEINPIEDLDGTAPDFIYGGPFIVQEKPNPFLNTATPINIQLQGTFKKSYAYYSLNERMPVILTKIVDYISRERSKIKSSCNASDEDLQNMLHHVSKLKHELATNKQYCEFTEDSDDADKWNEWIRSLENKHYYTNAWVWTECYIYRRLREACVLNNLSDFDPFEEQKQMAFNTGLDMMCLVADKVVTMLKPSAKDKRKADFQTLLKICLWANKCDLSQSLGEPMTLQNEKPDPPPETGKKKGKAPEAAKPTGPVYNIVDPFQMIIDQKERLLVDDTGKIADQVQTKAENMKKAIAKVASELPPGGESAEKPKVPCPAKMVVAQSAMFDIVCDNAGYELFADLCLAHFLIAQGIVQKVRFHVKKMPWFISDVTPKDFHYMISACAQADHTNEVQAETKPVVEGEEPPPADPPRVINSAALKELGEQWNKYMEEGVFQVLSDDFWTYPHVYKDMKKYDPNMYRKLQFPVAIMFKGDLNYRKLLGERNCNPYAGFEASLQGFIPAPIIAVRTVKSDLICGMPKGRYELLNKMDPKWMEKGLFGTIQYCPKGEALKISDRPCAEYGDTCRGTVCPIHKDL